MKYIKYAVWSLLIFSIQITYDVIVYGRSDFTRKTILIYLTSSVIGAIGLFLYTKSILIIQNLNLNKMQYWAKHIGTSPGESLLQ